MWPSIPRSSQINDPRGPPGKTCGDDSAYKCSRRALEVSQHDGFLAVSQRSFRYSRCENLHHGVDGSDFRRRTTALDFVNVRILATMCAPSVLGDMSTVGFFPAKHQSRRDNTLLVSLPDRGGFFLWYDRHGLEPHHAFPFRFESSPECFFCRFLFYRFQCTSSALRRVRLKKSPWASSASASCDAQTPDCIANSIMEKSPLGT